MRQSLAWKCKWVAFPSTISIQAYLPILNFGILFYLKLLSLPVKIWVMWKFLILFLLHLKEFQFLRASHTRQGPRFSIRMINWILYSDTGGSRQPSHSLEIWLLNQEKYTWLPKSIRTKDPNNHSDTETGTLSSPGAFSNWLSHAVVKEYFLIDCHTRVSRNIF